MENSLRKTTVWFRLAPGVAVPDKEFWPAICITFWKMAARPRLPASATTVLGISLFMGGDTTPSRAVVREARPTRTSGQPLINQSTLDSIDVNIPPPSVQRDIGVFLSALDNRIALLRETNTTLEAIAQTLFKSWFVDFDPVRAKQEGGCLKEWMMRWPHCFLTVLKGAVRGPVPKGWRVTALADAFDINPKRQLRKTVSAPYLDMASLATSGHCVEAPIQRDMGSGAKFRNGDTLLARITPWWA
ncbi:restriction endonuclease subunit S [Massilia polaris]|uniref:restriction endonuclease subunit S n=1 Tax=Massilia polaris TaxID=2728846 RepID=UPI001E468882|nr:restriction endonuclease subunit S [Massilia polaris]